VTPKPAKNRIQVLAGQAFCRDSKTNACLIASSWAWVIGDLQLSRVRPFFDFISPVFDDPPWAIE
jgi:hypothetical protein